MKGSTLPNFSPLSALNRRASEAESFRATSATPVWYGAVTRRETRHFNIQRESSFFGGSGSYVRVAQIS